MQQSQNKRSLKHGALRTLMVTQQGTLMSQLAFSNLAVHAKNPRRDAAVQALAFRHVIPARIANVHAISLSMLLVGMSMNIPFLLNDIQDDQRASRGRCSKQCMRKTSTLLTSRLLSMLYLANPFPICCIYHEPAMPLSDKFIDPPDWVELCHEFQVSVCLTSACVAKGAFFRVETLNNHPQQCLTIGQQQSCQSRDSARPYLTPPLPPRSSANHKAAIPDSACVSGCFTVDVSTPCSPYRNDSRMMEEHGRR